MIRRIGQSILHYKNNELILYTTIKKSKPMEPNIISKKNTLVTKFIIMDLETIDINNKKIPYLLCWYDGKKSYSYFLDRPELILPKVNYFSSKLVSTKELDLELDNAIFNLIKNALQDISRRKYKNYRIYLHNFAKFDSTFLIKHLAVIGHCKPQIFKGRLISFSFSLFNSKIPLIFYDYYLLLPSSLKKLCDSFNISSDSTKGIFPFKLSDITYKGHFPEYKYFPSKLDILDYNKFKKNFVLPVPAGDGTNKIWNFKDESIKYCNLDCKSLYDILIKFNDLIFNRFKLNIRYYPTLPSLAFTIFRTHFLPLVEEKTAANAAKKYLIHSLTGKISKNIRQAYTGGAVDMYIPKPLPGTIIYSYDVNSLYPFVMKTFKYPIGSPTYFEGDINKIDKNAFGFFFCKIQAPENLNHPILQLHKRTKEGIRTIAPLGNWEGMYFSEELYNARKFGYKFEIV